MHFVRVCSNRTGLDFCSRFFLASPRSLSIWHSSIEKASLRQAFGHVIPDQRQGRRLKRKSDTFVRRLEIKMANRVPSSLPLSSILRIPSIKMRHQPFSLAVSHSPPASKLEVEPRSSHLLLVLNPVRARRRPNQDLDPPHSQRPHPAYGRPLPFVRIPLASILATSAFLPPVDLLASRRSPADESAHLREDWGTCEEDESPE